MLKNLYNPNLWYKTGSNQKLKTWKVLKQSAGSYIIMLSSQKSCLKNKKLILNPGCSSYQTALGLMLIVH